MCQAALADAVLAMTRQNSRPRNTEPANLVGGVEVGQRARDPTDRLRQPRADSRRPSAASRKSFRPLASCLAMSSRIAAGASELVRTVQLERRITLALDVARGSDPPGHAAKPSAGGGGDQVGGSHRRHLDAQIDGGRSAGPRCAPAVRRATVDAAALAGVAGLVGVAAAAGVHRRDQHEARGVGDRWLARDTDFAVLHRLAQRVDDARIELGNSSRNSTPLWASEFRRFRAKAAAAERCDAGRMMRRAERPAVGQCAALELACN